MCAGQQVDQLSVVKPGCLSALRISVHRVHLCLYDVKQSEVHAWAHKYYGVVVQDSSVSTHVIPIQGPPRRMWGDGGGGVGSGRLECS